MPVPGNQEQTVGLSHRDLRLKVVFDKRSQDTATFVKEEKRFFLASKAAAEQRLAELIRRQPQSREIANGAIAGLQQAQTPEEVRLLEQAVGDTLRRSGIDGKHALIPFLVMVIAILSACSGAPVGEKTATASPQKATEVLARPEEGKKEAAAATPTTLVTKDGKSVLMGPSDYAKLIEKSSGKETGQSLSLKTDKSLVARLAKVLADTQALRGGVSAQGIVVIPESPVVTMDNYSFVLAMRPDETVVIAGFNPNEEYAGFLFVTANGQVMSEKPTTTTTDRAAAPTKKPAVKVETPPLIEATKAAVKATGVVKEPAVAVTGTATIDAAKQVTATAKAPEATSTVTVTGTETVKTDYKYTQYVEVGVDNIVYVKELDSSAADTTGALKIKYQTSEKAIAAVNEAIQSGQVVGFSLKPGALDKYTATLLRDAEQSPAIKQFIGKEKPPITIKNVTSGELAGIKGTPIKNIKDGSLIGIQLFDGRTLTIYVDVVPMIRANIQTRTGTDAEKFKAANESLLSKDIDVAAFWIFNGLLELGTLQRQLYINSGAGTYRPIEGWESVCAGTTPLCSNIVVRMAKAK